MAQLLSHAPVREKNDDVLPSSLGNLASTLRAQPCQRARESTATAPTNKCTLVPHEQLYRRERIRVIRLHPLVDHAGLSREHIRAKVIADTLNDIGTTFTCLV
jgi:hypothetical protein